MSITVKCVRCHTDWQGAGMVCNACRQIEATENLLKAENQRIKDSQQWQGSSNRLFPENYFRDTPHEEIMADLNRASKYLEEQRIKNEPSKLEEAFWIALLIIFLTFGDFLIPRALWFIISIPFTIFGMMFSVVS